MKSKTAVKSKTAAVGVCAVGLAALSVPVPATAAVIPGCGAEPVGGTIVLSGGVCTLQIVGAGSYSWTLPTGVTGLYALLVGGGSGALADGASNGYAGSGGSVRYVDYTAATGGTVASIAVGAGGATSASSPANGADTTVTVSASPSVAGGGVYGSVFSYCIVEGSFSHYVGAGSGAFGSPSNMGDDCAISFAPGLTPSADSVDSYLTSRPAIFSSLGATFGAGGRVLATADTLAADGALAGTGAGASVQYTSTSGTIANFNTVGGSGRVIFRYPQIAAAGGGGGGGSGAGSGVGGLADTGVDTASGLGIAGLLLGAGALLVAVSNRRRRTEARTESGTV